MLPITEELWSIVRKEVQIPNPLPSDLEATGNLIKLEKGAATISLYLGDAQRLLITSRSYRKLKELYETRGFSTQFCLWKNPFKLADYKQHNEKAAELYIDAYQTNYQHLHSYWMRIAVLLSSSH